MKILVFSDSHGVLSTMERAVFAENPDAVIHLGDCERDALILSKLFPDITFYNVPGNCDPMSKSPETLLLSFEDKLFFITHGHRYGVKYGLDSIINTAMSAGADVLLFGHTHRPVQLEFDGLLVINPGTVGYDSTYELIVTDGNVISHRLKRTP